MFEPTPAWSIAIFIALGLCIGSFLNVVIYRLPKMLEAQQDTTLSLCHPPSTCSCCSHRIRWFENIPVFSYLYLRGRCSACHTAISVRYPIIELATGALFAYCAWRWNFTATAALYAALGAALLTLSFIDWDTTYLPDDITVPLTWAGLIAAGVGLLPMVSLSQSLSGAVLGYLALWSIFLAFKLVTGRDGMGYGDFKLFAAIGAWLGWQALVPVILVASSLGAVVGLLMKWTSRERQVNGLSGYVPFGPFLSLGAALELATGWQP